MTTAPASKLDRAFQKALTGNPYNELPDLLRRLKRDLKNRIDDHDGSDTELKNYMYYIENRGGAWELSQAVIAYAGPFAYAGRLRPYLDFMHDLGRGVGGQGLSETAATINESLGEMLAIVCHPQVEAQNPGCQNKMLQIISQHGETRTFWHRPADLALARGLTHAMTTVTTKGYWPSDTYHTEVLRHVAAMGRGGRPGQAIPQPL